MSPLESTTSTDSPAVGPYRKPRADVFTFMLIVSLLAIIIGCLCLYFEMQRFEFEFKDAPKPPPVAAAPADPAVAVACLELPAEVDCRRAAV